MSICRIFKMKRWPEVETHIWLMLPRHNSSRGTVARPDPLAALASLSTRKSSTSALKMEINSFWTVKDRSRLDSLEHEIGFAAQNDDRSSWPTSYLQIFSWAYLQSLFVQLIEDKCRNLLENSNIRWNYTLTSK